MASFRFCETYLLHIKLFVGNQSAISPIWGGVAYCLHSEILQPDPDKLRPDVEFRVGIVETLNGKPQWSPHLSFQKAHLPRKRNINYDSTESNSGLHSESDDHFGSHLFRNGLYRAHLAPAHCGVLERFQHWVSAMDKIIVEIPWHGEKMKQKVCDCNYSYTGKRAFFKTAVVLLASKQTPTKFQSTTWAGARGGAGTCDAPCILGRVLDSAFMQARVRLSCSNSLIYTGLHTFRRHASPPRAAADGGDRTLVRSPREDFFQKSSGQILPSGPLMDASPAGYAMRGLSRLNPIFQRKTQVEPAQPHFEQNFWNLIRSAQILSWYTKHQVEPAEPELSEKQINYEDLFMSVCSFSKQGEGVQLVYADLFNHSVLLGVGGYF